MVSDEPTASRTELLDDYYAASFPMTGAHLERFQAIDQAVRKRNPDLVDLDFQRTHDTLVMILDQAQTTFSSLLFPGDNANNPIPRYFQAVFLAIHELVVKKGLAISDRAGTIAGLTNRGKNIVIQEGGRWGADNRADAVKAVVGMIQQYFEEDKNPDPAKVHWVTKLQNLLTNSKTEQPAYDFKQGFLELSDKPAFDDSSFNKILETCAAIANLGKGHRGYVVIGVAEKAATALRVEQLFGVKSLQYNGFYITGVEHEAKHLGKNLDQLFQQVSDRVAASSLSEPLKSYINARIKCVSYFDKTAFVLEVEGQNNPTLFNGKYYERQGTQVIEVIPERFPSLFERFK